MRPGAGKRGSGRSRLQALGTARREAAAWQQAADVGQAAEDRVDAALARLAVQGPCRKGVLRSGKFRTRPIGFSAEPRSP